ncbi:rubrerythrin family protein [bacterium]|nr:rubrerythrin family protein [bacterium]
MKKNSIQGSKTEKNLMLAFAGESQARNRYTYYASKAKKEGYEQISNIFKETAENEKEHAKVFLEYLENEPVEICAKFLTNLGDTKENLEAAIMGEHDENTNLYPYFAEVAEDEGFLDIAESFKHVTEVEKHHEARFKKLLKNIEENKVFQKDKEVEWKCLNCGYPTISKKAPKICPSCKHEQAYFEICCENY